MLYFSAKIVVWLRLIYVKFVAVVIIGSCWFIRLMLRWVMGIIIILWNKTCLIIKVIRNWWCSCCSWGASSNSCSCCCCSYQVAWLNLHSRLLTTTAVIRIVWALNYLQMATTTIRELLLVLCIYWYVGTNIYRVTNRLWMKLEIVVVVIVIISIRIGSFELAGR